ncbi:Rho guanine nucleotide exchange factor 4 [Phlyctochytrium bullatum]|nr:Rho guanine nucleotide exchange factor 4 [Phlyctochytrium bullatum]
MASASGHAAVTAATTRLHQPSHSPPHDTAARFAAQLPLPTHVATSPISTTSTTSSIQSTTAAVRRPSSTASSTSSLSAEQVPPPAAFRRNRSFKATNIVAILSAASSDWDPRLVAAKAARSASSGNANNTQHVPKVGGSVTFAPVVAQHQGPEPLSPSPSDPASSGFDFKPAAPPAIGNGGTVTFAPTLAKPATQARPPVSPPAPIPAILKTTTNAVGTGPTVTAFRPAEPPVSAPHSPAPPPSVSASVSIPVPINLSLDQPMPIPSVPSRVSLHELAWTRDDDDDEPDVDEMEAHRRRVSVGPAGGWPPQPPAAGDGDGRLFRTRSGIAMSARRLDEGGGGVPPQTDAWGLGTSLPSTRFDGGGSGSASSSLSARLKRPTSTVSIHELLAQPAPMLHPAEEETRRRREMELQQRRAVEVLTQNGVGVGVAMHHGHHHHHHHGHHHQHHVHSSHRRTSFLPEDQHGVGMEGDAMHRRFSPSSTGSSSGVRRPASVASSLSHMAKRASVAGSYQSQLSSSLAAAAAAAAATSSSASPLPVEGSAKDISKVGLLSAAAAQSIGRGSSDEDDADPRRRRTFDDDGSEDDDDEDVGMSMRPGVKSIQVPSSSMTQASTLGSRRKSGTSARFTVSHSDDEEDFGHDAGAATPSTATSRVVPRNVSAASLRRTPSQLSRALGSGVGLASRVPSVVVDQRERAEVPPPRRGDDSDESEEEEDEGMLMRVRGVSLTAAQRVGSPGIRPTTRVGGASPVPAYGTVAATVPSPVVEQVGPLPGPSMQHGGVPKRSRSAMALTRPFWSTLTRPEPAAGAGTAAGVGRGALLLNPPPEEEDATGLAIVARGTDRPVAGLTRGALGSKSTTSIAALQRQEQQQGQGAGTYRHEASAAYHRVNSGASTASMSSSATTGSSVRNDAGGGFLRPHPTTMLPFRTFPSAPFLPAYAKDSAVSLRKRESMSGGGGAGPPIAAFGDKRLSTADPDAEVSETIGREDRARAAAMAGGAPGASEGVDGQEGGAPGRPTVSIPIQNALQGPHHQVHQANAGKPPAIAAIEEEADKIAAANAARARALAVPQQPAELERRLREIRAHHAKQVEALREQHRILNVVARTGTGGGGPGGSGSGTNLQNRPGLGRGFMSAGNLVGMAAAAAGAAGGVGAGGAAGPPNAMPSIMGKLPTEEMQAAQVRGLEETHAREERALVEAAARVMGAVAYQVAGYLSGGFGGVGIPTAPGAPAMGAPAAPGPGFANPAAHVPARPPSAGRPPGGVAMVRGSDVPFPPGVEAVGGGGSKDQAFLKQQYEHQLAILSQSNRSDPTNGIGAMMRPPPQPTAVVQAPQLQIPPPPVVAPPHQAQARYPAQVSNRVATPVPSAAATRPPASSSGSDPSGDSDADHGPLSRLAANVAAKAAAAAAAAAVPTDMSESALAVQPSRPGWRMAEDVSATAALTQGGGHHHRSPPPNVGASAEDDDEDSADDYDSDEDFDDDDLDDEDFDDDEYEEDEDYDDDDDNDDDDAATAAHARTVSAHDGSSGGSTRVATSTHSNSIPIVRPNIYYAKALYDFPAKETDELQLEEEDIIVLSSNESKGGWLYGENHGNWGWFPERYIRILTDEEVISEGISPSTGTSIPSSVASTLPGTDTFSKSSLASSVSAALSTSPPATSPLLPEPVGSNAAEEDDEADEEPATLQSTSAASAPKSSSSGGWFAKRLLKRSGASNSKTGGDGQVAPLSRNESVASDAGSAVSFGSESVADAPRSRMNSANPPTAANVPGVTISAAASSNLSKLAKSGGKGGKNLSELVKAGGKTVAIVGAPAGLRETWVEHMGGTEAVDKLGISKLERKRQEVIYEIMCTERDYVDDLETVIEKILKLLEERQAECANGVIEQVGDIFISVQSPLRYDETAVTSKFEIISEILGPMPGDARDLKPVQRICKYPLLLRELIKNTEEGHPDSANLLKALIKIETVVTIVNEGARQAESVHKMLDIQNRCTQKINILSPSRTMKRHGTLELINAAGDRKKREVYLFNDMFLMTKSLGNGGEAEKLKVIAMVPFDMILVNAPPDEPGVENNLIEVVHINTAKFTLAASSPSSKQAWMNSLKEATESWMALKNRGTGIEVEEGAIRTAAITVASERREQQHHLEEEASEASIGEKTTLEKTAVEGAEVPATPLAASQVSESLSSVSTLAPYETDADRTVNALKVTVTQQEDQHAPVQILDAPAATVTGLNPSSITSTRNSLAAAARSKPAPPPLPIHGVPLSQQRLSASSPRLSPNPSVRKELSDPTSGSTQSPTTSASVDQLAGGSTSTKVQLGAEASSLSDSSPSSPRQISSRDTCIRQSSNEDAATETSSHKLSSAATGIPLRSLSMRVTGAGGLSGSGSGPQISSRIASNHFIVQDFNANLLRSSEATNSTTGPPGNGHGRTASLQPSRTTTSVTGAAPKQLPSYAPQILPRGGGAANPPNRLVTPAVSASSEAKRLVIAAGVKERQERLEMALAAHQSAPVSAAATPRASIHQPVAVPVSGSGTAMSAQLSVPPQRPRTQSLTDRVGSAQQSSQKQGAQALFNGTGPLTRNVGPVPSVPPKPTLESPGSLLSLAVEEEVKGGDENAVGETHAKKITVNKPVKKAVIYDVKKKGNPNSKDYVYSMRVHYAGPGPASANTGEVHHTFEDYFDMHLQLIGHFPEEAGLSLRKFARPESGSEEKETGAAQASTRIIPELPCQMMFVSEAVAKARIGQLQDYINAILALPPKISRSPITMQFLRIDGKHAQALLS